VLEVSSQESEWSCIYVLGLSSQESERSCICVLWLPSQESERSCICVLGLSSQESERSCICVLWLPSQESERSCICVLWLPSQESERLCICVLGVSTFPLSTIVLLNCTVDNHDLVNSYEYMCNKWPRIVSVCRIHNPSLSSFTTNQRVCIESNTTGAINAKGTAHITGAPDFILAFAVFLVLNRWLPRSVL
jgi:hypothetical protein